MTLQERKLGLLGLIASVILGPVFVHAEEMSTQQIISYISTLETKVAALEAFQNGMASAGAVCEKADCCCGSGGFYGGAEVTLLAPYISDADPNMFNRTVDSEGGAGVRYWLGWRNDDGLGIRGRHWTYEHGVEVRNDVPVFGRWGLEMDAVDLEITLRAQLSNYALELSGGVRYGRMQVGLDASVLSLAPGAVRFEGVGPTVAIEASRRIACTGFSFVGNFRTSMLFGGIDVTPLQMGTILPFNPDATIEHEITTVIENQLGVTWTLALQSGIELEFRALWESQFWLNDTFADDIFGIGSNLGFFGPTIGGEVRF